MSGEISIILFTNKKVHGQVQQNPLHFTPGFIQPPPRVVSSTPGKIIFHLLEFVWLSLPSRDGQHQLVATSPAVAECVSELADDRLDLT